MNTVWKQEDYKFYKIDNSTWQYVNVKSFSVTKKCLVLAINGAEKLDKVWCYKTDAYWVCRPQEEDMIYTFARNLKGKPGVVVYELYWFDAVKEQ